MLLVNDFIVHKIVIYQCVDFNAPAAHRRTNQEDIDTMKSSKPFGACSIGLLANALDS